MTSHYRYDGAAFPLYQVHVRPWFGEDELGAAVGGLGLGHHYCRKGAEKVRRDLSLIHI